METEFTIRLPLDQDGYATFECPLCRDSFQMRGEEFNADDTYEFWCPSCGLKSESYIPKAVMELAKAKVLNHFAGEIEKQLECLNTHNSHAPISIKITTNFSKEHENLLFPDIRSFEKVECRFCGRPFRVHPLTNFTGSYCPFCGETT